MKLFRMFALVMLFTFFMAGCTSDDEASTIKETKVAVQKEESVDKDAVIKEVQKEFDALPLSVNENNQDQFMSLQNEKNELFYHEQKRWFEEVVYKKKSGYEYTLNIENITVNTADSGTVDIVLGIKNASENIDVQHKVTYKIVNDNGWKLDDLPFKVINDGIYSIYYLEKNEAEAEKLLADSKEIVDLYKTAFGWDPAEINIKLFNQMNEMAATIPGIRMSGWNEKGESFKVLYDGNSSGTFQYLSHELTHTLLSDLTNDNASLYIQEGLATLLQKLVRVGSSGKVEMYLDYSDSFVDLTKQRGPLLTLEEVAKLNYSDFESKDVFYKQGSFFVNFLIRAYGMDKFKEFLKELKTNPYLDQRQEHKADIGNRNTAAALEKVYGPLETIHQEYTKYYEGKY